MSIEKYGLNLKEQNKKENPPEPKGPDLQTILQDSEQSKLFGAHLNEKGEHDLYIRFTKGESDASDVKRLNDKVKEFNTITRQAEELSKTLDINSLKQILEASSELGNIPHTAEGIRDVFRLRLPELAIRHPSEFKKISNTITFQADARKRANESDEKVKAFCDKFHIKEDDKVLEAIQRGDQKALEAIVRPALTRWRKFFGNSEKTRTLINKELDALPDSRTINGHLLELEGARKSIGDTLAFTITRNDMMRKALIADIKGETPEQGETDMSAMELMKAMDEKSVRQKYEEFKKVKQNRQKYGLDGNNPQEDRAREDFSNEYFGKTTKGKKGFFVDSIFAKLFFPDFIKNFL